jgi:hypothetical protein
MDSAARGLKAGSLHNGISSTTLHHSVSLKEAYANMKKLLEKKIIFGRYI